MKALIKSNLWLLAIMLTLSSCEKQQAHPGSNIYYPVYLENDQVSFINPASPQYSHYLNRVWEGCPSIERNENGEIFIARTCSFTSMEGANTYIVISYSKDDGKSWQNNKLFIAPGLKTDRFFDVMIFKDNNGGNVLCFTRCVGLDSTTGWDGKGGVWATKISYDGTGDSITYTKPVFMFEGIMNNKPTVTTVPGSTSPSIIFPVAVWGKGIYLYQANFTQFEDMRFKYLSTIADVPSSKWYSEPSLVHLDSANGYMAFIRDGQDGMIYARSKDLLNWSPVNVYATVSPNADARHCTARLKSGNLILIENASKAPDRRDMTVFMSNNNGASWDDKLLIDPRGGTSYPDCVQGADGTIYLTYDFGRVGPKEINFLKFSESNITHGNGGGGGLETPALSIININKF